MKTVILAAGRGVRMMPLTADTPKSLLQFRGKTLLDHIFDALPDDVDEVILVVDYLANKIKEYCGKEYRGKKIYYAKGSKKGSATSLLTAQPYIRNGERFFIIYGDDPVTRGEIEQCRAHTYSWLCYQVADPRLSGIATVAENGRILEVIEKPAEPKSNWAATGLMLIDSDIFNYEPHQHTSGEYYLTSLMNQFLKDHAVYAVKIETTTLERPQFTSPADLGV